MPGDGEVGRSSDPAPERRSRLPDPDPDARLRWADRRADLWRERCAKAQEDLDLAMAKVADLELALEDLEDHCDILEAANEALGEECDARERDVEELRAQVGSGT